MLRHRPKPIPVIVQVNTVGSARMMNDIEKQQKIPTRSTKQSSLPDALMTGVLLNIMKTQAVHRVHVIPIPLNTKGTIAHGSNQSITSAWSL